MIMMENTLVFLLMLCSFSFASEVKKEETAPCLSDIHAVLRDINAVLAKHQLKIEQLQTLNNGKLTEVTSELKNQASEVASLKKQLQEEKVAFSASLSASGVKLFGPFNSHTTLIFERVLSNIGNAYNPISGFFTAPVKGAYHFELFIYGPQGGSGAALVKNDQLLALSYENQADGYGSAANAATVILEAGDVVFPRLWSFTKVYDNDGHHSTFSGHLLFPM